MASNRANNRLRPGRRPVPAFTQAETDRYWILYYASVRTEAEESELARLTVARRRHLWRVNRRRRRQQQADRQAAEEAADLDAAIQQSLSDPALDLEWQRRRVTEEEFFNAVDQPAMTAEEILMLEAAAVPGEVAAQPAVAGLLID